MSSYKTWVMLCYITYVIYVMTYFEIRTCYITCVML